MTKGWLSLHNIVTQVEQEPGHLLVHDEGLESVKVTPENAVILVLHFLSFLHSRFCVF